MLARRIRALFLSIVVTAGASVCAQAQDVSGVSVLGWPTDALQADPAIVTGELDNGLHYMVRKHANPPGKAMAWMYVATGSLNETDRQRGLAHYLEHMAFNGSEHFPPGTLTPFFEARGMVFGRDENASTSTDHTQYRLSLPDVSADTLAKAMSFFADILSKLSLTPSEIEKERQIILEEKRRGLSASQRIRDLLLKRLLPGSAYGERSPIGTEDTIKAVERQDFIDYYEKWYSASNATILVVADAEPADVIEIIKARFANAPKRPGPIDRPTGIKPYEKSFAVVAADPELASDRIGLFWAEPRRSPIPTTTRAFRSALILRLGIAAMNRRLQARDVQNGSSFLGGKISSQSTDRNLRTGSIWVRPTKGWRLALEAIVHDLQSARTFGFTEQELDAEKKKLVRDGELAVEQEGGRRTETLIQELSNAVRLETTVLSPSQRLNLLKQMLPAITLGEVNERFRKRFDPAAVAFVAQLRSTPSVPTEAELLEAGIAALAVGPEQQLQPGRPHSPLIALPPEGGEVIEMGMQQKTNVWNAWLSNNARMHYRFVDVQKGQMSIAISLIGGEMLETADNRGITAAALWTCRTPATQHMSSAEIYEQINPIDISVGCSHSDGAITFRFSARSEHLKTALQLAYLMLTEPKIETRGFQQLGSWSRDQLSAALLDPIGAGINARLGVSYPASVARTQPLTPQIMARFTPELAQAWLEKLLRESPVEVTIVGDIPRELSMKLAAQYIGALPARARVTTDVYAQLRNLTRPKGPLLAERVIETKADKAYVFSGFYNVDRADRRGVRAMDIAARILSMRMNRELRENAQLVYHVDVRSTAGDIYPGFGTFAAQATTAPAKVPALVAKVSAIYDSFASYGPTEEELTVAKKQFANDWKKWDLSAWLNVLDRSTFRGVTPDEFLSRAKHLREITARDVREVFADHYRKENAIMVAVKPRQKP